MVLYFYPKDDTSGCTREACEFRDQFPNFEELNALILGVSPDSPQSHQKFIATYNLPFSLLSDESKEMLKCYGVWVEKSMYGRKYMGVERSTFILGPDGRILTVFRKVKPAEHAAEVAAFLSGASRS
ncbi:MAG: thioredoxin-dependent thiol peroxidase [Candidatus Methylacidiphilales bacterium]